MMLQTMTRRLIIFTIGLLSTMVVFTSCTSGAFRAEQPAEELEPLQPTRPRFLAPEDRPLNRILLTWEESSSVDGYEIQMSHQNSFEDVDGTWMVRGRQLEVEIPTNAVVWFRIRSFTKSTTSRWSIPLAVGGENPS